jgi:hypothetical protein
VDYIRLCDFNIIQFKDADNEAIFSSIIISSSYASRPCDLFQFRITSEIMSQFDI